MFYLIALVLSIVFIVIGIVRWKLHPFFTLLLAALGYGLLTGMDGVSLVDSVNSGFGGILGKIGIIIYFGVVIGTVLEKSGGAMVIAERMLRWLGQRSVYLAVMITGFLLSIPVFADSAFIIMNSLNKALTYKAGASYAGTSVALALGLMATHVLVPPTPGPIAAAGILGAPLANVILWGIPVALLALVPSYFFATRIASKVALPVVMEPLPKTGYTPKLWVSLLAIVIPIALIIAKSVLEYPNAQFTPSWITRAVSFLGTPVMALLVGVFLSLLVPRKLDATIFSATGWFGESLYAAAPIIMITGAGGIFGEVLQNSGIGEVIKGSFARTDFGLFFPFLLAACLKSAQGSSTVALIATASIMAPLMGQMGWEGPFWATMVVLSIGAGATVVSHANDSFFWVVTQLTGMDIKTGNRTLSLGTLVLGCSAMLVIYLITLVFG